MSLTSRENGRLEVLAFLNRFIKGNVGTQSGQIKHAPMAFYPTKLAKDTFYDIYDSQKEFNALYAAVASNIEFLDHVIPKLARIDEFTCQLWQIHQKIQNSPEKYRHKHTFGILRSDYMQDANQNSKFKQVEVNTVASGYIGLSEGVIKSHKSISCRRKLQGKDDYPKEILDFSQVYRTGESFAAAVKLYESEFNVSATAVLVVTLSDESNIFDIDILGEELINHWNILWIYVTLAKASKRTQIDSKSGALYYQEASSDNKCIEISVVYYRCAYSTDSISSAQEWENREMLEKSRAIKCPSILLQLAGLKKVQQLLASDSQSKKVFEKFLTEKLTSFFADIWPMDDSTQGLIAREVAFQDPENFVLKPQQEGGGNNIFGKDIPAFLGNIAQENWDKFILMKLIPTVLNQNMLFRNSELHQQLVISEVGIYGGVLFDTNGNCVNNQVLGYLNRLKVQGMNEGGITAGYGVMSSLTLGNIGYN